jgi:uncharacterized OsmC-like protein
MRQHQSSAVRSSNALRDATYRAIYRLEAGRPGAAASLCDTLQTAWRARDSIDCSAQLIEWLHKVTPLCLGPLADYAGLRCHANLNTRDASRQCIPTGKKGKSMQVQIRQIEGVRFEIDSRNPTIICDQPAENGSADSGTTPPELLLASLGSCAAFYAVQYLKTRNLADGGVEVSVKAEKLKQPARMGNFEIDVISPVPLTDEQHQAMMNSIRHCLIHNTLLSPPEIEINLTAKTQTLIQ